MRNDDPEYVHDLERSNRAMEDEIKYLTLELAQRGRIIDELHRDACPTFIGEPVVKFGKCYCDHHETCSVCVPSMWTKKGERDAD